MNFCTFLSSSRSYVKLQLLLRICFRKISCFFPASKGNMGCNNRHITGVLTVRVPLYQNLQNSVQFSAEGIPPLPPPISFARSCVVFRGSIRPCWIPYAAYQLVSFYCNMQCTCNFVKQNGTASHSLSGVTEN